MKQAAIIDVGSHSIRYAVGRVQDGQARMEPKRLESTHLAEGVSKTGRLGEVPMMRALWAIEAFARDAAERGVPVYAYATSAVRDSENRADFCQRAAALGVQIQVLEPAEEALPGLLGATRPARAACWTSAGAVRRSYGPAFSTAPLWAA